MRGRGSPTTPGNGGQTVTGTGSPLTVTGLTNGDTYTFTVTATNAAGTGSPSAASNAVTPAAAAVTPVPTPPSPTPTPPSPVPTPPSAVPTPAGPVPTPATLPVSSAPTSLAATGSDQALPAGLAGLLLVAGAAALGVARFRRRSTKPHIG